MPPATSEHPRQLTLTRPLHPCTIIMGKGPQITRQGARYEPYQSSSYLPYRRRGSPPPDSCGNRAGSHHVQLSDSIFGFLEDLNTRYGGRDLRELFRDHAGQPGALGQSIEKWIHDDEVSILVTLFMCTTENGVPLANSRYQMRRSRQPEPTDSLKTQYNNQIHCIYVPESVLGDESGTSRPPVDQPVAHHVSNLQDAKSLIVELNTPYRFLPLISTLSIQMSRQKTSVCIVFGSL